MKDEGQIYKSLRQIFQFLSKDLIMIFQSWVISPIFSTLKNHNLVPGQNLKTWGKDL